MKQTALAAFVAAVGTVLGAEGDGSTNEVAETAVVVVYASRIDAAKDLMPASVDVFDADEIAASGARDLPELLKKKSGVDVHAMNGNPLLTSIALRGFGDNGFGRVKVVLDGEELNNVDMNPPNLTRVPLGSAERVEVVRGPCPVLYGDGAIAGVVNVTTDRRDYTPRTRITGSVGSQGTAGANVRTRGGFEEEGVLYGAAYDYQRTDGYRDRSAYDIHSANAGVTKVFDNGSEIGFKANYQNAFYELPGALTREQWQASRRMAANPDDWARVWSYGAMFDSKLKLADDQWLRIDVGFSDQRRHVRYASSGSDLKYDAWCWQVSPRYVNEADIGSFANTFTAGFDFRYDRYREDHPSSFGSAVDRHFDRTRYAVFAYDEFGLTEELSVCAGARLERIGNRWSNYEGLAESSGRDWMGDFELGLVYRPADGLKTYVKATRFHRSAFCDELSYTQDGKFLEPERGYSLDVGAEWEFLEEFKLDVNGYGMLMEDEIFFDPVLLPYGYNCNSPDQTRRIGLDAGISWRRDKVAEASLRYGAVQAKFHGGTYGGCDVPYVPNHRVRADAGVWVFDDLEIVFGYTFVGSQYLSGDYANDYDKLPSHSLFDLGARYAPSWAEGWKAAFTIDNLLDRDYCDYAGVGYYYPACGRTLLFTLSYEF